ncbi:MAG: diguanylate cyclase domain-containing protein [Candidatus Baltobacteraceae bacterium]
MIDLGLAETPNYQLVRILEDCKPVLGFDYAEVGYGAVEYVKVCSIGDDGTNAERAGIGWRGTQLNKPQMVFDAKHENGTADHTAAAFKLRSILFWPIAAGGDSRVLAIGWQSPREQSLSEDEIQYLNFLAALISRLLDAAEHQRKMSERVDTDPLTGLRNRSAILEHLEQSISAAQRSGGEAAVLYLDLNSFKSVNDTYGHAVGDAALTELGRRMLSVVRKHEVVGRIGGDEFAVVVSSLKSRLDLEGIAARLLRSLAAPMLLKGVHLHTSASIGIAIYPQDGQTVNELLSQADAAMYSAKTRGSNALAFHDEGPQRANDRLQLHAEHFESQFLSCFQPIVAARTGKLIGTEVLVRWLQPDGVLASPARLLQAAVEQQCLREFERMMLASTMHKAAALTQAAGPITIHVNVWEPDDAILESTTKRVPGIALECNEREIAADAERYIAFFAAARAAGFSVGIAQFGSASLSLRTLAQMQIDFVKIGPEYFRESLAGAHTARGLKTLIDQAHYMSCTVIAEGVQTSLEQNLLVANGVDALQGFSICSPLTQQDFISWTQYRASA